VRASAQRSRFGTSPIQAHTSLRSAVLSRRHCRTAAFPL